MVETRQRNRRRAMARDNAALATITTKENDEDHWKARRNKLLRTCKETEVESEDSRDRINWKRVSTRRPLAI